MFLLPFPFPFCQSNSLNIQLILQHFKVIIDFIPEITVPPTGSLGFEETLGWAERLHYHKPRPGQTSSRQSGKGNSRLQCQHTPQGVLSECTQRIPQEAGCVHLQRNSQKVEKSSESLIVWSEPPGIRSGFAWEQRHSVPEQAHRRCVSAHRAWQHWAETSQNLSKVFRNGPSLSSKDGFVPLELPGKVGQRAKSKLQ